MSCVLTSFSVILVLGFYLSHLKLKYKWRRHQKDLELTFKAVTQTVKASTRCTHNFALSF